MDLGPYASFIATSYLAVAFVVAVLIGWITFDYRAQKARLRSVKAWIEDHLTDHDLSLEKIAKSNGAKLVIINNEPTDQDDTADLVIRHDIGETLGPFVGN